ncbi:oxidoreductase C-terminal domain-containing protein [Salinibacterium sp. ZJ454]|uniref:oxidoreductase C-terminal domain-containing protein n=1 Tax=Salinibacterium sp. ZJ454 TaxID=2708339 RepID=UPI00244398A3|nr:oxidoreductase C-terminal domain-containing protein [Salinibacterium sp. ZJ454]
MPWTRRKSPPTAFSTGPVPVTRCHWFWTHQYEEKLQTVGLLNGYDARLQRARPKIYKLANLRLRTLVQRKLNRFWSRDEICGWMRKTYPDDPTMRLSPETIYRALLLREHGGLHKRYVNGGVLCRGLPQLTSASVKSVASREPAATWRSPISIRFARLELALWHPG